MDAMRWTRTGEREKLRLQASPGVAKSAQGTFFLCSNNNININVNVNVNAWLRLATTPSPAFYLDRPAFIVGFTGTVELPEQKQRGRRRGATGENRRRQTRWLRKRPSRPPRLWLQERTTWRALM
ncbi:hypothetical protein TEQG_08407 [Trichophyton equinum CBS 127.97]|uniref:Uncharacterized protein n=1 Tax=Trichophyton equinum (strain ATCC MYA-4606 / CBS 127.97) TaxID=559882 RepID=F2Q5P4_TRIEC|nr:hypothetical protein TEQG_08407 [Trichophyton equinum CBS 127.97]